VAEGWYRTFFDRAANDHWNAALPASYTAEQVDFLVDRLGLSPGDRVLDLPAGRGRLALPLADRGIELVAVDISDDGTRGLLADVGDRPVVVARADMQAVPLTGGFDAVYCMGNSFGYFPVDGVERFLAEVTRLLRPGGRFVLESATVAESMAASFAERTEHDFGGVRVIGHHRADPAGERVVSDLEVHDADGVRHLTIDQLSLPSARIAELVEAAGLEVDALLGDLDGGTYDASSGSLLVLAHRP
jgi:cyclopropane fatty-acyl-phospholipid synthase-like methyltransferase